MSKGGVSGISGVSESRAALIIAELIKEKKGKNPLSTTTGEKRKKPDHRVHGTQGKAFSR